MSWHLGALCHLGGRALAMLERLGGCRGALTISNVMGAFFSQPETLLAYRGKVMGIDRVRLPCQARGNPSCRHPGRLPSLLYGFHVRSSMTQGWRTRVGQRKVIDLDLLGWLLTAPPDTPHGGARSLGLRLDCVGSPQRVTDLPNYLR